MDIVDKKTILIEHNENIMALLKKAQWVLKSNDSLAVKALTGSLEMYVMGITDSLKLKKIKAGLEGFKNEDQLKTALVSSQVKKENVVYMDFRRAKNT